MRQQFLKFASAVALVCCAAATARADLRIKQRMTMQGHTVESDVAIKGQRQRTETEVAPGMKNVSVMQCDLKRILQISDAARKYTVTPFVADDTTVDASAAARPAAGRPAPQPQPQQRGGVVTYVTTLTDTGERKQMFGFTARRIKTVMKSEHSADACDQEPFHYETDGWYIDFEFSFDCMDGMQAATQAGGAAGGCRDRVRFRRVGAARLGYPVQVTTKFFRNGQEQFSQTTETVSLSRAALDPALFDVPAGYTEARDSQELYNPAAMAAAMSAARRSNDGDDNSEGGASAAADSDGDRAGASSPGAKRAGVLRVGVIAPGNKTDKSVSVEALRASLIAELTAGGVEAVALDAASPGALAAEAQSKQCDFILYTDISALKQSTANKIGGFLGRATGASDVKERYEARVDYSLVAAGSSAPLITSMATSKEDGPADAALSAAARREAQSVLAKIRK
jgi:hypothetical protein